MTYNMSRFHTSVSLVEGWATRIFTALTLAHEMTRESCRLGRHCELLMRPDIQLAATTLPGDRSLIMAASKRQGILEQNRSKTEGRGGLAP